MEDKLFHLSNDLLNYEVDLNETCDLPTFVLVYLSEIKSSLFNRYVSIDSLLDKVEILIDYSWEKLNTNIWVFVNDKWRYLYAYSMLYKVLVLNMLDKSSKNELIRLCDLGLLMSGPLLEKQFNQIISQLSKSSDNYEEDVVGGTCKKCKYNEISSVNLSSMHSISIETSPSIEHFQKNYFDKKLPIIIDQQMQHWPAIKKWSIEYIRNIAGMRTVPIEIGSKYTDENWSQKLMTINEFINKYILNKHNTGYLAQHPLFDQIPELRDDIYIPEYCYYLSKDENIDEKVDINAWFGPKDTVSPLHQDPKHNFLCQVIGKKYFRLYDDKYRDCLYVHKEKILQNTSELDVENIDYNKYPLVKDIPYLEGILNEGQMLYIPPKCWHFIKSLSISFSVSFWWN